MLTTLWRKHWMEELKNCCDSSDIHLEKLRQSGSLFFFPAAESLTRPISVV